MVIKGGKNRNVHKKCCAPKAHSWLPNFLNIHHLIIPSWLKKNHHIAIVIYHLSPIRYSMIWMQCWSCVSIPNISLFFTLYMVPWLSIVMSTLPSLYWNFTRGSIHKTSPIFSNAALKSDFSFLVTSNKVTGGMAEKMKEVSEHAEASVDMSRTDHGDITVSHLTHGICRKYGSHYHPGCEVWSAPIVSALSAVAQKHA